MRDFWILTKLQLSSLFGINKILHMKNGEEKKQGKRALRSFAAMTFALCYFSVLYSVLLGNAFEIAGMLPALLGLMALAASLLILMFSIFETKGVLFGFGDYDIVMSWPVSVRAVAASRVFSMYTYNFVYALLILFPAGIVYAIKASLQLWFYPLLLLLILLIPALPTIIGALLGTVLTLSTARMKKGNLIGIIAQMALIIGIMMLSMRGSSAMSDPAVLANSAEFLRDKIAGSYPPAVWFQNALSQGSLTDMIWLVLLTAGSVALLLFWIGKNFVSINSRIKSKPRGETFVMHRQARSGLVAALFKRELSRYFSSSLYVVNTAFSYVMLLAASVALVVKADALANLFEIQDASIIKTIVPFLLGWIVSMGTTTASSVSMEGKSIWIVKSMPVSARDWFVSKIMVTLMMSIPCILISSTLVVIGLKPGFWDAVWIFLIPLIYSLVFAVFGLWLNLRMPRLDWKNEAEVIKQSGAVMVTVFTGMGLGFAPAVLSALTGSPLVPPVVALLVLAAGLLVWNALKKNGDRQLLMLH